MKDKTMEKIAQAVSHPPVDSLHLSIKLPLYLRVALCLFMAFALLSVLTWALVQNRTPPPPNPFVSFADIFPGQPESAVEARGTSHRLPTYNFYGVLSDKYYSFTPAESIFSDVRVTISHGIISQTIFVLRDNPLRVGDLAELFRTSNMHVYLNAVYFVLPNNFVIAKTATHTGRFSLFLPVWSVSFNTISA
jgi:hypothetical protein